MDGVTRVPFNLPAVVHSNVAIITEGEKDANEVQKAATAFPNEDGKLSYATSTNIGGAGKWQDDFSPYFTGKKVFVFADNDEAGRKHAQQVCASVSKHAQAVHLIELPGLAEHGDVSDYLKTHSPSELFALLQSAPVWTAPVSTQINGNGTGFKLVELGELLSRPEEEVDYVVDGIAVRGTVMGVFGKPKVGERHYRSKPLPCGCKGDGVPWAQNETGLMHLSRSRRAFRRSNRRLSRHGR